MTYPKEIRGYKVERAAVEVKTRKNKSNNEPTGSRSIEDLISFGDAKLDDVTPLKINLEIPIVVAPVTQKGHVEFLVFENMVVNGTPVDIDEYRHPFDLPNKKDQVLKEPLKFSINLPSAILAAIDEWTASKETWQVTGRVYVFGSFKKFLLTFKRAVPIELTSTMRNPLLK